MNDDRAAWGSVPCFKGVGERVLMLIRDCAHVRAYQAGATIFTEGEASAGFHIVTEGLVRIYRISPEGRPHTLNLLRPVSSFNEVAAVDGQRNPYNATAVTQVQVAVVGHTAMVALLAREPSLMASTLQALAQVNREYIERLEDMTFRSIPSRLAKLFLHEATSYAGQIAEAPSRLSQEDIASILGTTREVVGRALRGLINAQLLAKRGREFFITDRAGLERLAETNEMPAPSESCPLKPPR
jgi:CRP/FNR family transcriptional regulator, dissimilatory nitrate respiration regulator